MVPVPDARFRRALWPALACFGLLLYFSTSVMFFSQRRLHDPGMPSYLQGILLKLELDSTPDTRLRMRYYTGFQQYYWSVLQVMPRKSFSSRAKV